MIPGPLNRVPLNTKKVFVMGRTASGTEVYMPVNSLNDAVIDKKKKELQVQLTEMTKDNGTLP